MYSSFLMLSEQIFLTDFTTIYEHVTFEKLLVSIHLRENDIHSFLFLYTRRPFVFNYDIKPSEPSCNKLFCSKAGKKRVCRTKANIP